MSIGGGTIIGLAVLGFMYAYLATNIETRFESQADTVVKNSVLKWLFLATSLIFGLLTVFAGQQLNKTAGYSGVANVLGNGGMWAALIAIILFFLYFLLKFLVNSLNLLGDEAYGR